jgi:hypothetical protein
VMISARLKRIRDTLVNPSPFWSHEKETANYPCDRV